LLDLEKHEAGAKYHAVGEEKCGAGTSLKSLAEAEVPVVAMFPEAAAHFGWWQVLLDQPFSVPSHIQTYGQIMAQNTLYFVFAP
jgi:hypothetical protein